MRKKNEQIDNALILAKIKNKLDEERWDMKNQIYAILDTCDTSLDIKTKEETILYITDKLEEL